MTYKETLNWMFSRLPMYQNQGATAFKNKLDGISSLSFHLGEPHTHFKSIHIAGTNGKGSSSHMLASVLQEAGYKVGLYTSPHLKDFRERIKINGKAISKAFVIGFIKRNQEFFKKHQLSFFEMTVGMAFDYFTREKVDIAIIEVGLGGRLDSTNIITPEISLITNIGMDHTDLLGDTLKKITYEKAGIIKTGIPVVISEFQRETFSVFKEIAKSHKASLVLAEKEIKEDYKTDLLGGYQKLNVKGVISTLKLLSEFKVSDKIIRKGLMKVKQNTGILGRWQELKKEPRVICDTAHNKEGLTLVLEQLSNLDFKQLHIVLGFVKDKNLSEILPLFPKSAIYYFCTPNIQRGLDSKILAKEAGKLGLKGKAYSGVSEAYKEALERASKLDIVYIGGSTFVVAEVV